MKKLSVFLYAVLLVLGVTATANTALIDRGGGLIYCDTLDITLLQDTNYAWSLGYDEFVNWETAMDFAANLEYYDSIRGITWTDWRLATTPVIAGYTSEGELGHIYVEELGNSLRGSLTNTDPFINLIGNHYWTSTIFTPNGAFAYNFNGGQQWDFNKNSGAFAWSIRDGDVGPVPIPSAVGSWGLA